MSVQPIDHTLKVYAAEGMVLIDDSEGCIVTLTPDAAMSTSDLLMDAAAQAHGQEKQRLTR